MAEVDYSTTGFTLGLEERELRPSALVGGGLADQGGSERCVLWLGIAGGPYKRTAVPQIKKSRYKIQRRYLSEIN